MNIPSIVVPTYEAILPSTGETIKMRPFLMKEEKLLLMAGEGASQKEQLNALDEVVKNCTFGKVGVETHPIFDVQYVFLQARAKSVGEVAEIYLICGACNHKLQHSLNLSEINVVHDPAHNKKIQLTDTVVLTMKYPNCRQVSNIGASEDVNVIYDIISDMMDTIYTEEAAYDCSKETIDSKRQFLDSLTASQFKLVREFFETMPKLIHRIDYECPSCTSKNNVVMENLSSFFE